MPDGLFRVALTVDAEDDELEAILESLAHRHAATARPRNTGPGRRSAPRFRLPVMKAVGVADEGDLAVLDRLCAGRRPDAGRRAARRARRSCPAATALAFDWRLMQGRRWTGPWMLAGGLTPDNVAEAVRLTGAVQVDVSSGVERAPGDQGPRSIAAFIRAAKNAPAVAAG